MFKKSGRILHITIITLCIFISTSIIFKNFKVLSSNKVIDAAKSKDYFQDKNELSESSIISNAPQTTAQEPTAPVLSTEQAEALSTSETSALTTTPPSNSVSSDSTSQAAKAPSNNTSTMAKNQKVTTPPKPATKPAVYTVNNSGRTYKISAEERNLFARLVNAEATSESYEGKLAVATVVINRLTSGVFPGSLTQIIMGQEGNYYQFTPVQDGRINIPPSADALKAVDQVLGGYRSFSSKIMWFLNPKKSTSGWIVKNKTYYKTIGNHDFYY